MLENLKVSEMKDKTISILFSVCFLSHLDNILVDEGVYI